MENNIETYSLHDSIINNGNFKNNKFALEHEMLLSKLNDYTIAYDVNEYLWRADVNRGHELIKAIYQIIPSETKHIFMLYTNISHKYHLARMTQNLWAYPNSTLVNQYLPLMLEQLTWATNSHLIELPLNPNFEHLTQNNDFNDPYYYQDYHDSQLFSQTTLINYRTIMSNDLTPIPIKPNINKKKFTDLTNYNRQIYQLENKILTQGLTRQLQDDCKRLNQLKQKLHT